MGNLVDMERERHIEGRKVERWEGRRRPREERDGLRGGIGNICGGLTAAPPSASSRQPHTTKPGDGPEMVLGLTAKVMIHGQCFVADRQCFMKERWQLTNAKQMQMTQCIVYYMGVFKYDLYINCERQNQTKQNK